MRHSSDSILVNKGTPCEAGPKRCSVWVIFQVRELLEDRQEKEKQVEEGERELPASERGGYDSTAMLSLPGHLGISLFPLSSPTGLAEPPLGQVFLTPHFLRLS